MCIRDSNWFQVDWNLISLNLDYKINENARINFRNYTLQGGRDAVGLLSYINRPDNGGNRDVMTDQYNNFGSELRYIPVSYTHLDIPYRDGHFLSRNWHVPLCNDSQ